jgi:tRNA (mo5U34)-methyltransferase
MTSEMESYVSEIDRFVEEVAGRGLGDVGGYYWYHTVDLGDGLITPGMYDYRSVLANFDFPDDMGGMRVLDVGPATGFFAFEFEKRGAEVSGLEVPSIGALDRFPGQTIAHAVNNIGTMLREATSSEASPPTLEEDLYHRLLEAPFDFCRRVLGSQVERCFASVHDLSPEIAGHTDFDLVFLGDILLHTINPLGALAQAAALCNGTLILAQAMPDLEGGVPAFLYVGGEGPAKDDVSWWVPTKTCLIQLLTKLGFDEVYEVGVYSGRVRPGNQPYERQILHAVKN